MDTLEEILSLLEEINFKVEEILAKGITEQEVPTHFDPEDEEEGDSISHSGNEEDHEYSLAEHLCADDDYLESEFGCDADDYSHSEDDDYSDEEYSDEEENIEGSQDGYESDDQNGDETY